MSGTASIPSIRPDVVPLADLRRSISLVRMSLVRSMAVVLALSSTVVGLDPDPDVRANRSVLCARINSRGIGAEDEESELAASRIRTAGNSLRNDKDREMPVSTG